MRSLQGRPWTAGIRGSGCEEAWFSPCQRPPRCGLGVTGGRGFDTGAEPGRPDARAPPHEARRNALKWKPGAGIRTDGWAEMPSRCAFPRRRRSGSIAAGLTRSPLRGQCRNRPLQEQPASRSTPVKDRGTSGEVRDSNCQGWGGQGSGRSPVPDPKLLHELLGDENVAQHARKCDHQDHLQHDAGSGNIAADLAESTTPKRLHQLHLQIDLFVIMYFCNSWILN